MSTIVGAVGTGWRSISLAKRLLNAVFGHWPWIFGVFVLSWKLNPNVCWCNQQVLYIYIYREQWYYVICIYIIYTHYWRAIFLVFFFSVLLLISGSQLLCFSAFPLFHASLLLRFPLLACFSAFLRFPAFLLFCFFASLLLRFSVFPCFSASLLLCFLLSASLLFLAFLLFLIL